MELTKTKDIEICPIRELGVRLCQDGSGTKRVAVILSQNEVEEQALRGLDSYIRAQVADTEEEGHPFAFSVENGADIRAFLKREEDFGRLYVCCDSGQSRSTAMAAAIMRFYRKPDTEIWKNPRYHPNTLVYGRQLWAFGIKTGRLKLKYLKHINSRALKKEIDKRR